MAAWIAGAAAIGGDLLSQAGQQETNAMSTANMLQQERWQTAMSDTAMQRRVVDLKAAGLNPMLAVGSNGAQVGSVSGAQLSNPDASLSGLGGQVQGAQAIGLQAASTASQVALNQAQAQKASADARLSSAQADRQGSHAAQMGDLDYLLAQNSLQTSNLNVSDLVAQMGGGPDVGGVPSVGTRVLRQELANLSAANPGISADARISQLDAKAKGQLFDALIKASSAEYGASSSSAQAQDRFNNSRWGQIWHSIVGSSGATSVGSGASAAGSAFSNFLKYGPK